MDPLAFHLTAPGRYIADNALKTRRYVIQKIDKSWHLSVWRLQEHVFTHGENLYLTDGERTDLGTGKTKWEAVAHANMWEADKLGDREAKRRFHNEMADRWIGTDLPADLTAELRERLYI